jgi:asparagine synthase (glutamine-hydrolysing)
VSGIVGVYYLDDRPVAREALEQMNLSLAHRGPDGAGLWSEQAVGLGHRMLWTTPESLHEKQPMASANGEFVITADARIDNRDELIAALGMTDRSHEQITDSALILGAYEKWGDASPERLLGDFAYVIWDRRRRSLFCARDHFGVRTLYYYYNPGKVFAFASEIKALRCLTEVPHRLNEVRLGDYLAGILEDKTSTFYQDVLRLSPAYSATIGERGLKQRCYWSLDPTSQLRLGSNEEYAAAFRETFTEAVRCRLRSNFPVGSHLSGGLDSSSITCVARDLLAENQGRLLDTYSIIFDEVPESDERPFIQAVVEAGGIKPQYVRGDVVTPCTDIDRVLWHLDEPFHGPNLFLHWQVWSAAQRRGVRVLLDGIMGDNVVSHGFVYLSELARSWHWLKLAREIKRMTRKRNLSSQTWRFVGRYIWNDGMRAPALQCLTDLARQFGVRNHLNKTVGSVIHRDFVRRVGLSERAALINDIQQTRLRSEKEDHYQEIVSGGITAMLEVLAKAGPAFNIEVRVPFLDRRLVELCFAMPPDQKLRDGLSRSILRRALAETLPRKIRLRVDKGNVRPNFLRGLATERVKLEHLLANAGDSFSEYVDFHELRHLCYRFLNQQDMADEQMMSIYMTFLLSTWFMNSKIVNGYPTIGCSQSSSWKGGVNGKLE